MPVFLVHLRDLAVQVQLQLSKLIFSKLESVLCLAKFNLYLVKLSFLEIVLS